MTQCEFVVGNHRGVHARVAAELARIAMERGPVHMVYDDEIIDCCSALEVLSLGLAYGTRIIIRTDGEGEREAMAAVEVLLNGPEDT